jgi:DNA-binding CsgD family transcriptional regulator/catechol 2,3-dioxygenase-like lactoylglutathione lyase family enzyme
MLTMKMVARSQSGPAVKSASKSGRGRPRYDDVLTPAEWRIVQGVRHGLSNVKIARLRGISLDAVKFHTQNAMGKLHLDNREALRRWRGVPKLSALNRESTMNVELKLGPVGQISRSVKDIQRAEEWYGKVLGLPHLYTFGKLAFFDCGGTRLFLSEQADVGPESILYLRVTGIQSAYDQLQARGVEFTGAPHMIHKHADGTEDWMVFFKDLEGRPLALMSQVAPS